MTRRRTPDLRETVVNWVQLLQMRAAAQPDEQAFDFLTDGDEQQVSVTYAELDRRARAVASRLRQMMASGGRALLLYPPGLDFIFGLLGSWYAGMTAVPAYPPRSAHHPAGLSTLRGICQDAKPSALLSVSRLIPMLGTSEIFRGMASVATDEIADQEANAWTAPLIDSRTLACLQYTSGSTSAPKGVMLTHENLLEGSRIIKNCFDPAGNSRGVIWLPPYHDMGLIGGILQPLYVGMPVTLMAPASFLQRPLCWLNAISRTRAAISGGPNFAYDLCVRQIGDEQRQKLDLSCWQVAFNGAEPVDAGTLDRFAEAFAPCGFRREAFHPCYGLAEATLMVCGGARLRPPVVKAFRAAALGEGRVEMSNDVEGKTSVGCGTSRPENSVRIVDPLTRITCPPGKIGEIWVQGGGIAAGYWQKPSETQEIFHAHCADTGEGPFLRTGDLGFLDEGELFITGRLKDVIIVRGRNHYPQDIERTARMSHLALRPAGGAAFSVRVGLSERLVILHELERAQRGVEPQAVMDAIREAVALEHDLAVSAIVLLKPGQLLKTSSGKVRRGACREEYLNGGFERLALWEMPEEPVAAPPAAPCLRPTGPLTAAYLEELITTQLASALNVPAEEIDPAEPFARYGLDSAGASGLAGQLEVITGQSLAPTLFYDYPTIRELAAYLANPPTPPRAAAA